MKIDPSNYTKYLIQKTSLLRKFVTSLDRKGAVLPVLLLEGTVTGGRTYQAYKRDGFVEARERLTEESLGAVFWLYGTAIASFLFDKIGQKFMKIPKDMPSVGVDEVRTPFKNYITKMASKLTVSPKYLAQFSVGKTIVSLLTACMFIGYVVPKANQAITKHIYGRMNKKDPNHEKGPNPYTSRLTIKDARSIFSAKGISINAVDNFKALMDKTNPLKTSSVSAPSFKGSVETMLRIVQNFDENRVWQLLGTDVGTVSGRTINARNNDERVEIMFRDLVSIPFYVFTMPLIVKFMSKHDKFKGLNTGLNPMSAMETHNKLVEKMGKAGLSEMTPEAFRAFVLGNEEQGNNIFNKVFGQKFPQRDEFITKKFLGLIPVKQKQPIRTITLSEFEELVNNNSSAFENPEQIKNLAQRMSGLQPEKYNEKLKSFEKILTETQVSDVLKGGAAREPEFLKGILENIFEGDLIDVNSTKSLAKKTRPLTNPYKYISQESIEKSRQKIIDYIEAIIKDAVDNNKNVDFASMLKLNKRNYHKYGLFMGLGMGVSALFLSTIIPKIQYYITYLRTGKNSFPGTEGIKEPENNKIEK